MHWSWILCTSVLGLLAFGCAEASEASPSCDRLLRAARLLEVRKARDQIETQRRRFISDCLDFLRANLQKEHEEFGGRIHQVLRILGFIRAEEVVPLLSGDMLMFHSDIPAGIRLRSDSPQAYPAAVALASIGGPQVIRAAIDRLATEEKDAPRRLCLWILERQLGQENLVVLLKHEAARLDHNDKKRRLLRAATEYSGGRARTPSLPDEDASIPPAGLQSETDIGLGQ